MEISLNRTAETVSIYNNSVFKQTFRVGLAVNLTFRGLIIFNDNQKLIVLTESGLAIPVCKVIGICYQIM